MKCPFCDRAMKDWRVCEDEENTAKYLKCPKCGFVATFVKPKRKER